MNVNFKMRMLRWVYGVTNMDRIRHERIRGITKVGEISKKVQKRRIKWYGYMMRKMKNIHVEKRDKDGCRCDYNHNMTARHYHSNVCPQRLVDTSRNPYW